MERNARSAVYNHIPDACLFVCAGLTFAIADIFPAFKVDHFLRGVGWTIALIGATSVIASIRQLRKHRTSTNPTEKPSLLLTNGLFQYSRNPLYVGYVTIVLGCAFISESYISLSMPLACFLIINFTVVPIEESMLLDAFGDTYKKYARNVPRWL